MGGRRKPRVPIDDCKKNDINTPVWRIDNPWKNSWHTSALLHYFYYSPFQKFAVEIHKWTSKQQIRHSLLTVSSPYPTNQCWHLCPSAAEGMSRINIDLGGAGEFLSRDSQNMPTFFSWIVVVKCLEVKLWYKRGTKEDVALVLRRLTLIYLCMISLMTNHGTNAPKAWALVFRRLEVMRHNRI